MYVWFDALTNYLSGVHALVSGGQGGGGSRGGLKAGNVSGAVVQWCSVGVE